MEVGVRELRDNLSRYLGRVRAGQEIVVTDRGDAVARLTPIGHRRAVDRLIAEGLVTPARRTKGAPPVPVTGAGPVSDLVDDQRR